jgi:hypothetical protein
MAQRVSGYEDNSDAPGGQLKTTKPISAELKSFLDQTVLEGRLHEEIDADPTLKPMLDKLSGMGSSTDTGAGAAPSNNGDSRQ